MTLCVDCKHCFKTAWDTYRCQAPQNRDGDLVGGNDKFMWILCETHRADGIISSFIFKTCGKRARWFEPKE